MIHNICLKKREKEKETEVLKEGRIRACGVFV